MLAWDGVRTEWTLLGALVLINIKLSYKKRRKNKQKAHQVI